MVVHNTACTHESQALYQGRLHKGDKERAKIENVFHLNSVTFPHNFGKLFLKNTQKLAAEY